METKCHECGRDVSGEHLSKCPICFRHFCQEHSYVWSGRSFCTRGCAEQFFFVDED